MFPPLVRLILVIAAVVASGYRFLEGSESWVIYLAAALLLIYEHFKGGSIYLAFQAYRKQDFEKVRKYLDVTKKPDWLRPSAKAYYNFLQGVISTVDKNYEAAKAYFLIAAKGPLRTEHLNCLTHCILADTALHLGEVDEARGFLQQARSIPHRDEIKPMFEDLEKRIQKKA